MGHGPWQTRNFGQNATKQKTAAQFSAQCAVKQFGAEAAFAQIKPTATKRLIQGRLGVPASVTQQQGVQGDRTGVTRQFIEQEHKNPH
jgi:hypothetical protein